MRDQLLTVANKTLRIRASRNAKHCSYYYYYYYYYYLLLFLQKVRYSIVLDVVQRSLVPGY
jgi:hypothetical protein